MLPIYQLIDTLFIANFKRKTAMLQPSPPPSPLSTDDTPQQHEPDTLQIQPLADIGDPSLIQALADAYLNSILAMWVPISPKFMTNQMLVDRRFCVKGGWKIV